MLTHRVFESGWERGRGRASGKWGGGACMQTGFQTQGRVDPKDSEGHVVRTGVQTATEAVTGEKTHICTCMHFTYLWAMLEGRSEFENEQGLPCTWPIQTSWEQPACAMCVRYTCVIHPHVMAHTIPAFQRWSLLQSDLYFSRARHQLHLGLNT